MNSRVNNGAIPGWDRHDLRRRDCPACQDNQPDPWVTRPDGLIVHRCRTCQMLYLADIPQPAAVDQFYRSYSGFKRLSGRRWNWLSTQFRRHTDPYIAILKETGGLAGQRVADVGCAFGEFLQSVRASGGLPWGVELDDTPVPYLQQLGIPVATTIDQFAQSFDVVTSFQVLEHLTDPDQFLQTIARCMSPDGRLLVAVPNGGDAEAVGSPWVGFRVDLEHFNYFTVATLSRLLMRHGFFIEGHWQYFQPHVPRQNEAGREPSFIRRAMRRCLQRAVAAIYPESRMVFQGGYVLAVLARYVPQSSAIQRRAA